MAHSADAASAAERRREAAYARGMPRPSSAAKAKNMRAVKRTGTQPELLLRRALHADGLRFRVDLRLVLSGHAVRPDIVFTRRHVAVFVDSCFWHKCPRHGTIPASNTEFWTAKLTRNAQRDFESDALLREHGWSVVRVWEHDGLDDAVERVRAAVYPPSRT